ncbi:MAG: type III-B CRISPR module-associated protein Cmr5 [Desulfurococcales archaeon]|nr:type III-B CRISPR module-associated protein Cmr5 [Desulfurococcales archaeon]
MKKKNISNPLEIALEHSTRIAHALEKLEEHGRGIRSRARELPGLLAQSGLIPTVVLYMSKVGGKNSLFQNAFNFIDKGDETVLENIREEFTDKEGTGYIIFLAAIASALSKLTNNKINLMEQNGGYNQISLHSIAENALKYLSKPSTESIELAVGEKLLLEYLLQMKRLLEAFIPGTEE